MDSKRTPEVADAVGDATPLRTPAVAYPFLTRREIAARVEADTAFAAECALVLESRTQQRAAGDAPAGRPWGWMSSERVVASGLVAKLSGSSLTETDKSKLAALVRRYSRQLADHCRSLALKENPELAAIAEKFGALPASSGEPTFVRTQPETSEAADPCGTLDNPRPETVESPPDDDFSLRIVAHVAQAPGQRTEEMAKVLDVTTAMLAPTLRMLVQGRRLKKRGVGRGTRYFRP